MKAPLRLRAITLHRLAIPMRLRFEHAAASRATADPIVLQLSGEAPYGEIDGFGETLARAYVTGETAETVVRDIGELFVPRLDGFRAASFIEALEFIDALPVLEGERVVTAARAAVELALLDLAGRAFRRDPAEAGGWLGLPGFGPPGCLERVRYSGIVLGKARWKLQALLRVQRAYGLRDFKLKVAIDGWERRVEWAHRVLRRGIEAGRATLRVDANGGWTLEQALAATPLLDRCGVCAIEQPLPPEQDEQLVTLAPATRCDLIADESLVTVGDAQRLLELGVVDVFNIRIAKVGGLLPALRLARMAQAVGLGVQLGCLVGETSILSAAGAAFLRSAPGVRFAEGAFGRWLLAEDVTRRPVRFGRGGRVRVEPAFGLGVEVDAGALERLAAEPATVVRL